MSSSSSSRVFISNRGALKETLRANSDSEHCVVRRGRGGGRRPAPGLVDLPAEEHPVGGDAAGGQQLGAVVGRGGQLGNDRGARRGVGVHHAQEFPISEVKREKHVRIEDPR